MRLGCSEVEITPQVPINLGGYGQRQKPAQGIASSLFARGFILEEKELRLGLITADLLILNREQADLVKKRAGELTGINPANIVMACSHTHSGPSPEPLLGNPPDPVYIDWLLQALAGTLFLAEKNLEEVTSGFASCPLEGIGADRRLAEAPVDSELIVLGFATGEGKLKALLYNYACHPTVLGPDNLLVSPDYPGEAAAVVKKVFPGTIPGFLNGACGDISTRFTRRSQSHAEARRLGTILGTGAAGLAAKLEFAPARLAASLLFLPLQTKAPVAPAQAEAEIGRWQTRLAQLSKTGASAGELRQAQTGLEGALLQKELEGVIRTLGKEVQISLWQIGDLGLAAIPGELFSALGRMIKDESPYERTMVAGYSNGYIGYIPHREAYRQGGYETLSSPLAPGFGETLAKETAAALHDLRKE